MSDKYDGFGDVQDEVRGIFGNDQAALKNGLKEHESVKSTLSNEGVIVQIHCQGCGRVIQMTIEWPEIMALRQNMNPANAFSNHPGILQVPMDWKPKPRENAWTPDYKCNKCGFHLQLLVSARDANRWLAAANHQGMINPQGAQQIANIITQRAQGR